MDLYGSFGLIYLGLSAYLTGLIWTVQLGVYPAFRVANPDAFVSFHKRYTQLITVLVAPAMLIDLGLSTWWLIESWTGSYIPSWIGYLQFFLSGVGLVSTFFIQVPIHNALSRQWSETKASELVNTNWIRTFAWTLKLVLTLWALDALPA
jgi:hypothetical protein